MFADSVASIFRNVSGFAHSGGSLERASIPWNWSFPNSTETASTKRRRMRLENLVSLTRGLLLSRTCNMDRLLQGSVFPPHRVLFRLPISRLHRWNRHTG